MPDQPLTRRDCLKRAAGLGIVATLPWDAASAQDKTDDSGLLAYLETLARPDGGYGWPQWDRGHLTPTFAVVGCHHLLKQEPPRRPQLVEFLRTRHPFHLKVLEHPFPVFEYQQLQALRWLGEDVAPLRAGVAPWTGITKYPPRYEEHGDPPFQLQAMVLLARDLLGLPAADLKPEVAEFFARRRRANGSFGQTRREDGGDGHVMHTWHGLQALRVLGRPVELRDETVAWLRACQLPAGGFTYRPNADVGGVDDVVYTRAALRALQLLGAEPADRNGALGYLRSLRNGDGGFGDRPGWDSNSVASYYALDALDALGAVAEGLAGPVVTTRSVPRRAPLADDLKVFTIQVEAPGNGSPSDAVELARALRIDLWGAKNAQPGWIEQAQALAKQRRVPVTFFVANEEYGTHVDVPGLGDYNHVSDMMAPAGSDPGPSLAGPKALSWKEFRERRVAPLEKAGGLLYWQFGDNEEYDRALLDESVERGGYLAVSSFHFGNPDFANSEPWLNRYAGRLPFLALQDAHGGQPWWWSDMLAGVRTFFLAKEPTWEAWREALRQNRVAAVRHDAISRYQTWRHGAPDVLAFLARREAEWRWWGDRLEAIRRPIAVIAVVRPEDRFEAGRPEKGAALRVRTWWDTTAQGEPKAERARLLRLEVDGQPVETTLKETKNPMGRTMDRYHLATLADPKGGVHHAVAVVQRVDSGAEERVEFDFAI